MAELFTNNAFSTLASGISTSDVNLTVASSEGSRFPSPSGADFFRATLIDKNTLNTEIVLVTSRTGDTFTMTRAQEGTTALALDPGDLVQLRPTAGTFENVTTDSDVQSGSMVYASDTGAANAYAIALTPAITAYAVGQKFRFRATNPNTGASTLNVNGLGVKTIKKFATSALESGDIIAGQVYTIVYDGTDFQLQTPIANLPAINTKEITTAGNVAVTGDISASGDVSTATLTVSGNATHSGTVTFAGTPQTNNNVFYSAKELGGTVRELLGLNAADVAQLGNASNAMTVASSATTFTNGVLGGGPTGGDQGAGSGNWELLYVQGRPVVSCSGFTNVTSSRAQNTVYQNTSGITMLVSIAVQKSGGLNIRTEGLVGTTNPPTMEVGYVGASNAAGDGGSMLFPVPHNWYYQIYDASTISIRAWHESS